MYNFEHIVRQVSTESAMNLACLSNSHLKIPSQDTSQLQQNMTLRKADPACDSVVNHDLKLQIEGGNKREDYNVPPVQSAPTV